MSLVRLSLRRSTAARSTHQQTALRYAAGELRALEYAGAAVMLELLARKPPRFSGAPRLEQCAAPAPGIEIGKALTCMMRSTEQAIAGLRRGFLAYAAGELRELGYRGAAAALDALVLERRSLAEAQRGAADGAYASDPDPDDLLEVTRIYSASSNR